MLKIRIVPCLDVKDGRVVKGINFLKPNCDKKEILKCVGMILPNAESIVECIYNNTFDNIFNLIMRE